MVMRVIAGLGYPGIGPFPTPQVKKLKTTLIVPI
jgi:hypothetical protein